jgi:hypothetical protein
MITFRSEVKIQGISGNELIQFMVNCTDADYQEWWPGTHLAFHTIKRYPDQIGNLVYFDEYVGKYRLKFHGVVREFIPAQKIVWQMKFGIRLPVWIILECRDQPDSLYISHTVRAGFCRIGSILDPVLKIYLTTRFFKELDNHAHTEFPMLAKLIEKRRSITAV